MKVFGTDRIITVLRRTRKAYLAEYLSAIILILLSIFISFQDVPRFLPNLGFLLGVVIVIYTEFSRLFVRYKLMNDKLVIIQGFLKQERKNIYYHPLGYVPDINIKQRRMERVLDYGTISLRGGGSGMGDALEIKDISKPHKVMDQLEGLIQQTKK